MMTRRSVMSVLACLALTATSGLAVGADKAQAGGKSGGKTIVIGLVAKSNTNPVFLAARQGAMDKAKELSEKLGMNIRVDWRTPTTEDGQKQAEFIEQLVAGGANAISVSASDAKLLKTAIDSAVAKGVPVMTFDSDVPDSKRFAFFGTDDFQAGQRLGRELGKSMGGKGVVAILAGNQNAPNLQNRVRGVKDALGADFKDIKILDTYYHPETPQDAVAKVEQVMGANPQITGWAMVGGWPLMTENAMGKVRGRAKVMAVDALPAQLNYVRSGEVEMLLAQQVYEWGTTSVEVLVNKLTKNESPKDPIMKADLTPVTKANVEEYAKNWERWAPSGK
jgi:ribose transport system substrate-binding protein